MACLSKIRAAIYNMTTSERKLAQLLITSPQVVLNGSAKSIGESCGISAASVVRFAQMLGFSSLQDMKDDLRNDIEQGVDHALTAEHSTPETLESLCGRFCSGIASGMATTKSMLSFTVLEQAVELLCNAKTIYLYGCIASSYPARDLQQKLVRMKKCAVFREERNLGILDAYSMTEEDLMIVFSFSGTHDTINKAVQIATKRGIKCIAVTRFGRSPLANMATHVIPLPDNDEVLSHYIVAQSKYESLMIADLLFAGYVIKSGADLNEILAATSEVVGALGG